jgi:hypothetical protein
VTAYEEAAIAERQHLQTASFRLLPDPNTVNMVIRYEAHLTCQLNQGQQELEATRTGRHGRPTPLLRLDAQGPTQALAPVETTIVGVHETPATPHANMRQAERHRISGT